MKGSKVTEEQFQAWKASPATGPFLRHLEQVREQLKERWAQGEDLSPTDHAIAMVYGDVIDLDYERDIAPFYEDDDEEHERHTAD